MIEVKYLQDCRGADKHGTCMGCGKFSKEDPNMVRVSFKHDIGGIAQGVTVCLCNRCREELCYKR
jgi:hypothetical protein